MLKKYSQEEPGREWRSELRSDNKVEPDVLSVKVPGTVSSSRELHLRRYPKMRKRASGSQPVGRDPFGKALSLNSIYVKIHNIGKL